MRTQWGKDLRSSGKNGILGPTGKGTIKDLSHIVLILDILISKKELHVSVA